MKHIAQVRYYGTNNANGNNSEGVAYNKLVSGSIFKNHFPMVQLNIQATPGTKFYLNNSPSYLVVGPSGIYNLNLNGVAVITALNFDAASINAIHSSTDGYLIIDYIYETEA